MARVQGFSEYEYVLMTHPISSLDQQQIRERAEQALPQVLKILGLQQTGSRLNLEDAAAS